MPSCHDCGQPIQFIDGKPYDMEPALHYRNRKHIEATRGRLKKQAEPVIPPPSGKDGGATEEEWAKLMERVGRAAIERAEKEKG